MSQPILLGFAFPDTAPKNLGGELHTVAYAQDGHGMFEQGTVHPGIQSMNTTRTTRKDYPLHPLVAEHAQIRAAADYFRIDLTFSYSPGDQLCVLRTKINNCDHRQ
jgi:hypothetical protein